MNWSPYTGAVVLAAVRTTRGHYFGGANIETANISLSKHAEEVAVVAAIASGAMVGPNQTTVPQCIEAVYMSALPCGSCRQFLFEFASADCVVYVDDGSANAGTYALSELLPRAFGPAEQRAAGGQRHT
jgi:cytidine deaminase